MAFTAKKSDNSIAAVVNDYEAAIAGGLQLLGYGYVNYSEEIANNFVKVAENFANTTPPASPLKGQLWWNTSGTNPSLWVCRDPTAAASPVTSRWSKIFEVNASTGNVDAWTLRGFAPSKTSVADTVVVRDASGKIDTASLPGSLGATNLDGLSDVTVASPQTAQFIRYNGSQWTNMTINLDDLNDVSTAGATNGSILKFNGTNWVVGTDNFGTSGSTAAWGGITGTLGNQTDLVNFINGKTWPISAVSGLQGVLDSKLTFSTLLTQDGSGTGLDADLLDGQHGSYYLQYGNMQGSLPSDAVLSAFLKSGNGYAKMGDFIIQWGRAFVSDSGAYVTLPTTFPNAHLFAIAAPGGNLDGGDESDESYYASPYSVSQIRINADGDFTTNYANWISIGY